METVQLRSTVIAAASENIDITTHLDDPTLEATAGKFLTASPYVRATLYYPEGVYLKEGTRSSTLLIIVLVDIWKPEHATN